MTMTPSLQSGGFPSTTRRTLLSTPSTSRPRMSLAGSPIEFIAAAYLTPDSPFLIISGQARLLLQGRVNFFKKTQITSLALVRLMTMDHTMDSHLLSKGDYFLVKRLLSLKSRTYLGPTAMDAEVDFLLASLAVPAEGKLVYDPFIGTDIDIRVVHDRGPDCNIWSNFKQHGLPAPISLPRADNNLPPWRPSLKEIF